MARKAKVLIITNYAPPMPAGSPIMLGRLLENFPQHSYTLLTNRLSLFLKTMKIGQWLPCVYYFLGDSRAFTASKLTQTKKLEQFTLSLSAAERLLPKAVIGLLDAFRIQAQAKHILAQEPHSAILTTSDMGTFLIGGYLAARQARLPLYIYLFDLYAGNAYPLPVQLIARLIEPAMFQYATKIFVTSHHTQEYLQRKYPLADTKFIISPHPAPILKCPTRKASPTKKIVYTGAIYWAQLPNLQDLVTATRNISGLHVSIHGPLKDEDFKTFGLTGENIRTGALSHEQAVSAQCEADILFLPMAFDGPSRDILETASPGKIAEYLMIGKPILVYAPPYSHIARYAKEEGFALVVDEPDPEKLRQAIETLLTDRHLCQRLQKQAQRVLQANHQIKPIQAQFQKTLLGSA